MKYLKQISKFLVFSLSVMPVFTAASQNMPYSSPCKAALLGDYQNSEKSKNFVQFDPCRYKDGVQPQSFQTQDPKTGIMITCSCKPEDICAMFENDICSSSGNNFTLPGLLKPTKSNPRGDIKCSCDTMQSGGVLGYSGNTSLSLADTIRSWVCSGIGILAAIVSIILYVKRNKLVAKRSETENNILNLDKDINGLNQLLEELKAKQKKINKKSKKAAKTKDSNSAAIDSDIEVISVQRKQLQERKRLEQEKLKSLKEEVKLVSKWQKRFNIFSVLASKGGVSSNNNFPGPESLADKVQSAATIVIEHQDDIAEVKASIAKFGFDQQYKKTLIHSVKLLHDIASKEIDVKKLKYDSEKLANLFIETLKELEVELRGIQDEDLKSAITEFKQISQKYKEIFEEQDKEDENTKPNAYVLNEKLEAVNSKLRVVEVKVASILKKRQEDKPLEDAPLQKDKQLKDKKAKGGKKRQEREEKHRQDSDQENDLDTSWLYEKTDKKHAQQNEDNIQQIKLTPFTPKQVAELNAVHEKILETSHVSNVDLSSIGDIEKTLTKARDGLEDAIKSEGNNKIDLEASQENQPVGGKSPRIDTEIKERNSNRPLIEEVNLIRVG